MALHQYIGARYVPKFYENSQNTNEWRAGVIYEPLTIVSWNGNSYTSKKVVPANIGDPSSNPEYWAATGLYNTQVEELRQEVEALKEEMVTDFILFPSTNPTYNPSGHCMAITHEDHAMLVDLGRATAYDGIRAQLKNYGIEYIDVVIISHYHADHDGNGALARWAEDFDFSSCTFYLPLDPPASVTDLDPDAETNIRAAFAGCTFIKPPYDDIVFFDYDVEAFNCDQADFNYYAAQGDTYLNTYSTIVRVSKNGTSVTNMSDVSNLAQERQLGLGNFKPSTIATAPHHGLEGAGSRGAAAVISPQYLYISDAYKAIEVSYRDPFILECVRRGATVIANTATYPNTAAGSFKDFTTLGGNVIKTNDHYDARAVFYVDPTISSDTYQDGTATHPFKSFLRALSLASGMTEINLLADIPAGPSIGITGAYGFVYIKGGGHTVNCELSITRGGLVELENIVIGYQWGRISQSSIVTFGSGVTWIGDIREAVALGTRPTLTSNITYRNAFISWGGTAYTGSGTITA